MSVSERTAPKQELARSREDRSRGLGALMRELRKAANLTQADAAIAMGLERTSVCNIEAGVQPINVEKLAAFARAVGAEVSVSFRPLKRGTVPSASIKLRPEMGK